MFIGALEESISKLPGVGPAARQGYSTLGVSSFSDLLRLSPRAYDDRTTEVHIGQQEEGQWCNTYIQVVSTSRFGPKRILKVVVKDMETERRASLLCFNRDYLERVLVPGRQFAFYGNVQKGRMELQCTQFEVTAVDTQGFSSGMGQVLPIYPLAASMTQRIIRRDVKEILSRVKNFDDELPLTLMEKYKLESFDNAIRHTHLPKSIEEVNLARRTLAFGEVFYLQMISRRRPSQAVRSKTSGVIHQEEKNLIASLPFKLTTDQEHVLSEIRSDMASESQMNRLLQGDVGSGKTLVAWVSAVHAICEGAQVAFMAPTELLARQHAEKAAELFAGSGIRLAFLTGSVKGKERQLLMEQLRVGNIDLIIGTHALFSKDVVFHNLRYIIIDEQHRFGVEQRLALLLKGESPDVLLMTATPIPRTLALTVFGDLNVSTIHTMPPGRIPIETRLVRNSRRADMYAAIGVQLAAHRQAYFVCPRIDDEGESNLKDVQSLYTQLSTQTFPSFKGRLIHSRLPEEEKVEILRLFSKGEIDYLVSTSVVEVGIDVPNATVMVIEHAEHFGLSALHQLRGRVGRSTLQSWCFLVFEDTISDDGKKRLSVMRRSNDGFEIAEEDLKIRGPGELTGVKQSGFLRLRYADLQKDVNMFAAARDEVDNILTTDPGLLKAENAVIRQVLDLMKNNEEDA